MHRDLLPVHPTRREFDGQSTLFAMRMSTISKLSLLRAGSPALVVLGARVRRLRLEAGLTQAEAAGPFSAAYVSAIEHGKIIPSLPALVLLATRLGVTPSDLLTGVNFLVSTGYTPGHAEALGNQGRNRAIVGGG